MGIRLRPDEADDVLQSFVADRVLEKGLISHADRERGKFRTFLLATLNNYLVSSFRHRQAKKRSPGAAQELSADELELSNNDDPADAFNVTWARQVLAQAVSAMETHCAATNAQTVWGVFECRILNPILGQEPPLPYDQLVVRFKLRSPSQAMNLLTTAKRMFARTLRSVIGEYVEVDREIDGEIEDLKRILSAAHA